MQITSDYEFSYDIYSSCIMTLGMFILLEKQFLSLWNPLYLWDEIVLSIEIKHPIIIYTECVIMNNQTIFECLPYNV